MELDTVFLVKHFIVDGLENLVRKFGKGNPRFQTGRHHIFGKHRIDIEKLSVITQKIKKCQFGKPIIVVDKGKIAVTAEKFFHLCCQAIRIVLYLFFRLENTLRFSSARIADRTCASANQNHGTVTCQLETFQNHERNQVADVHAVPGRVNAAVKRNFLLAHQLIQALFISLLVNGTAPCKFINNIHQTPPFFFKNILYIISDFQFHLFTNIA